MRTLENDRYYRYCTYLYLPLQYAGLTFGCWMWVSQPMGGAERFAMAATLGIVGGVGINAAHELGHKRTTIERRLAKIALAQSFYGHFYVEHNRGHHARVATPEDPATARMGESYWRFLPRSVFGSLRSAIRYEKGRLERRGTSFWNLRHNDILNAWALSVVLYAVLIAVFGWSIAPWLVVQAVMAIMFLEGANYLEHYGCCARSDRTAVTNACSPSTAGTATTCAPTCSSTTCNGTATITPIRCAATRPCGRCRRRRSYPPVTRY